MESPNRPENESIIQVIMQGREGGERNVETPAGAIDLLTDQEVIEIKHIHNWKDATKMLVYQTYFPDRQPRVHPFSIRLVGNARSSIAVAAVIFVVPILLDRIS